MGKKSKNAARANATATAPDGDVPVVGMREPCPCGSGRRYKACHGKGSARGVEPNARPFEGFASECDLVALRELVPSATAPLTLSSAYATSGRAVTLATVLPMAWPALVRADGDVMLGGLDWSRRIVDHVSEQFERKHGSDPREVPETMQILSAECENAKRELSSKAQTPINVYHQGKSMTLSLTRGDFERMTGDLMQRTRDTTELVMQQAGVAMLSQANAQPNLVLRLLG